MSAPEENWYIVKRASENCEILSAVELSALDESATVSGLKMWGPFESKNQAIAKRVGLIRAGKCQPH
ncbi:MAG: DDE transposase family protein [Cyanobacteria bacterium J06598_3]